MLNVTNYRRKSSMLNRYMNDLQSSNHSNQRSGQTTQKPKNEGPDLRIQDFVPPQRSQRRRDDQERPRPPRRQFRVRLFYNTKDNKEKGDVEVKPVPRIKRQKKPPKSAEELVPEVTPILDGIIEGIIGNIHRSKKFYFSKTLKTTLKNNNPRPYTQASTARESSVQHRWPSHHSKERRKTEKDVEKKGSDASSDLLIEHVSVEIGAAYGSSTVKTTSEVHFPNRKGPRRKRRDKKRTGVDAAKDGEKTALEKEYINAKCNYNPTEEDRECPETNLKPKPSQGTREKPTETKYTTQKGKSKDTKKQVILTETLSAEKKDLGPSPTQSNTKNLCEDLPQAVRDAIGQQLLAAMRERIGDQLSPDTREMIGQQLLLALREPVADRDEAEMHLPRLEPLQYSDVDDPGQDQESMCELTPPSDVLRQPIGHHLPLKARESVGQELLNAMRKFVAQNQLPRDAREQVGQEILEAMREPDDRRFSTKITRKPIGHMLPQHLRDYIGNYLFNAMLSSVCVQLVSEDIRHTIGQKLRAELQKPIDETKEPLRRRSFIGKVLPLQQREHVAFKLADLMKRHILPNELSQDIREAVAAEIFESIYGFGVFEDQTGTVREPIGRHIPQPIRESLGQQLLQAMRAVVGEEISQASREMLGLQLRNELSKPVTQPTNLRRAPEDRFQLAPVKNLYEVITERAKQQTTDLTQIPCEDDSLLQQSTQKTTDLTQIPCVDDSLLQRSTQKTTDLTQIPCVDDSLPQRSTQTITGKYVNVDIDVEQPSRLQKYTESGGNFESDYLKCNRYVIRDDAFQRDPQEDNYRKTSMPKSTVVDQMTNIRITENDIPQRPKRAIDNLPPKRPMRACDFPVSQKASIPSVHVDINISPRFDSRAYSEEIPPSRLNHTGETSVIVPLPEQPIQYFTPDAQPGQSYVLKNPTEMPTVSCYRPIAHSTPHYFAPQHPTEMPTYTANQIGEASSKVTLNGQPIQYFTPEAQPGQSSVSKHPAEVPTSTANQIGETSSKVPLPGQSSVSKHPTETPTSTANKIGETSSKVPLPGQPVQYFTPEAQPGQLSVSKHPAEMPTESCYRPIAHSTPYNGVPQHVACNAPVANLNQIHVDSQVTTTNVPEVLRQSEDEEAILICVPIQNDSSSFKVQRVENSGQKDTTTISCVPCFSSTPQAQADSGSSILHDTQISSKKTPSSQKSLTEEAHEEVPRRRESIEGTQVNGVAIQQTELRVGRAETEDSASKGPLAEETTLDERSAECRTPSTSGGLQSRTQPIKEPSSKREVEVKKISPMPRLRESIRQFKTCIEDVATTTDSKKFDEDSSQHSEEASNTAPKVTLLAIPGMKQKIPMPRIRESMRHIRASMSMMLDNCGGRQMNDDKKGSSSDSQDSPPRKMKSSQGPSPGINVFPDRSSTDTERRSMYGGQFPRVRESFIAMRNSVYSMLDDIAPEDNREARKSREMSVKSKDMCGELREIVEESEKAEAEPATNNPRRKSFSILLTPSENLSSSSSVPTSATETGDDGSDSDLGESGKATSLHLFEFDPDANYALSQWDEKDLLKNQDMILYKQGCQFPVHCIHGKDKDTEEYFEDSVMVSDGAAASVSYIRDRTWLPSHQTAEIKFVIDKQMGQGRDRRMTINARSSVHGLDLNGLKSGGKTKNKAPLRTESALEGAYRTHYTVPTITSIQKMRPIHDVQIEILAGTRNVKNETKAVEDRLVTYFLTKWGDSKERNTNQVDVS